MSLTKTQICNMALYHLGTSKEISNIDATSEASEEARTLRVFWDVARVKILTAFAWPFAKRVQALGLIEEDPTEEWSYSYTYPSTAIAINKIQSGLRLDNRQSTIVYQVANKDDAKVIFTDLEEAIAEYTLDMTSTALFPFEFSLALSYLLASLSAPKLSKGDPLKMKSQFELLYRIELGNAISKSLNEQQIDVPPDAEMIRGRE